MAGSLQEFLQQFITRERLRRFDEVLAQRTRQVTVVLENIYHEHNASACLRTCDCFGIQDVHVIEAQNSFRPNQEIAMGAAKWLTVHRYRSEPGGLQSTEAADAAATTACLRHLREQGYRILATSPQQHSISLSDVQIGEKTAVIFGAEKMGISELAAAEADELICIPMRGFTESLNVSVSAAIVMQHLITQLHSSELNWRLTDAERRSIQETWVQRTLGARVEPLRRRFAAEQQNPAE